MTLDQNMYKALNEAWEKQKQITTSTPTWGDGFKAGWKAGLNKKRKEAQHE